MSGYDKTTWSKAGEIILSASNLDIIKKHLKTKGNIAVEHWHFYGSRSPTPLAFDDYEEFVQYLHTQVRPGDAIDVYAFPSEREALVASGKYPDQEGRAPEGGAY